MSTSTKIKVLFVMNNLTVGGAEKSLISLLQVFDYNRYQVDLLLFKQEGLFLSQVPAEVNLLPVPVNFKYFDMPFTKVVRDNWKPLRWNVIIQRIRFKLLRKKANNAAESEQLGWPALSKTLPPLKKKYDAAIGYLQNTPNFYVIDKVISSKKFGFIHNDYAHLGMNKDWDYPYFKNFDKIITVSEESKKVLNTFFPHLKDKFIIIKNLISANSVRKLSQSEIVHLQKNSVISVGRLTKQKNYYLSIAAFKILYDKQIDFTWYILGAGDQEKDLKKTVKELGFLEQVKFLGVKENPYPYMKSADIFLSTSEFEGDGIVVSESKVLNKPIVLTNFSTAQSHINNGENGFIAEMSSESVANLLEKLLTTETLRKKFSEQLAKEDFQNCDEVQKLYDLIEN